MIIDDEELLGLGSSFKTSTFQNSGEAFHGVSARENGSKHRLKCGN